MADHMEELARADKDTGFMRTSSHCSRGAMQAAKGENQSIVVPNCGQ